MSYMAGIRTQIENLILGTAGSNRKMDVGRFHIHSAEVNLGQPANSAERAFLVEIGAGSPLDGTVPNPMDGFALMQHDVRLTVRYLMTEAGGDAAEMFGEQDGPGTSISIADRISTDNHDLMNVLQWPANWAGMTPAVVDLVASDPPSSAMRGNEMILELSYRLIVNAPLGNSPPGLLGP